MRDLLARVERDRLRVGELGAAPVPLEHAPDVAEREVRLGEARLQVQRALGGVARQLERAPRLLEIVLGACDVNTGDHRVPRRKRRLDPDRLREGRKRLLERDEAGVAAIVVGLVPVEAALQILLVRRRGRLSGHLRRRRVVRCQLHGERLRDARRHIGLHREAVRQAALVGLGPEVRLAGRFHQARGDPHPIAFAPDTALEQVVCLQRLPHLSRAEVRFLEHHRRPPREDADAAAAQLPELRDHLLGQAVAEVRLVSLSAQVGERQHGEPDAWSRARRCVRRAGARSNLRDEPVSTPRQRFHEPGVVRIVTERGAEPLHGGVQAVVEVDERAVRPQAAAQLLARDHVARSLEHHLEDFERLFLEAHGGLAVTELPGSDIELERSEPER
ncbi:MAG TPA: hypothetical protein VFO67_21615 [Gemmatimonadales bacterium]|nr:hypothetical protein [Gemmatimonadales bacterium]